LIGESYPEKLAPKLAILGLMRVSKIQRKTIDNRQIPAQLDFMCSLFMNTMWILKMYKGIRKKREN
jgi:hypothetical protein